jgi:hypothetical protein
MIRPAFKMLTYSPVENAVMVWNWSCVWEYGAPGMGLPVESLHTKSNVASVVTLLIWIWKASIGRPVVVKVGTV